MSDDPHAGASPTDALRAFGARVSELAEILESEGFPTSPADRARGVRHALRQLVMGIQSEGEHSDSRAPSFHEYEQPWLQWGGPNPDNVYLRAPIDPAGTYRVWGDVRGVRAVIFSLVGAYYYLRIVKLMYFDDPKDAAPVAGHSDMRVLLSLNGLALLVIGIIPQPLMSICFDSIRGLF